MDIETSIPEIEYKFTSFSNISKIESNKLIDVIGICLEIKPLEELISKTSGKELTKKDIHLIDENRKGIKIYFEYLRIILTNYCISNRYNNHIMEQRR